jgi:predicted acetyltransferase
MNLEIHELTNDHAKSFLNMMDDFAENDPQAFQQWFARPKPWSEFEFRAYLKECEAQRLDWKPGPNRTSVTRYVLLNPEGQACGFGEMRFPLDEKTEIEGGNLSFVVPPARRGGMFEAHTLNRLLFEAVRAGLARVLVTALVKDQKAVEAIEMNRGEFQDEVPSISQPGERVRRYWIRFR